MTRHLGVVPDSGPPALTITLPDPVISRPRRHFDDRPPSACPQCGQAIEVADRIRKVSAVWMHASCAHEAISQMSVASTWLMLAEQVAATPSQFSAREIRVIVRAIVDIAERVQLADAVSASVDTPDGEPS